MVRSTTRLSLLASTIAAWSIFAATCEAAPNVVIFLADDAGWGDYSHSGNHQVATPNIDSIATQGVSLHRFFVCPVCSPTRAEFLTGRYHPRCGVRSVSTGQERLNLDEKTIADAFHVAGYACGAFAVPERMTGRSLVEVLKSTQSGQVDPRRTAVFIGRERHVDSARADFMPYPQRAIRTHDFLYIINFKPDRWPLGDPYRLDGGNPPTVEEVTEETRVTLPDEDAGPTKAWLVGMRKDPRWKPYFDWAYGKRPREELYDLKADPQQTRNVAADPAYGNARAELEQQLLTELRRTGDPRLVDDGRFFETPPLSGPASDQPPTARKKGQRQ
ncbi:MAG TPA: sulfatase-like hydrolase/transferase [Planctomycetaceae bacterium]|jgi:hypothetical protein